MDGRGREARPRTKSSMDLGEARESLDKLVAATNSGSRTDCVKQILFQLERLLERDAGKRFVFGDIRIHRG